MSALATRSRGFNSGPLAYQDNPTHSWSTGTNANVRSHYLRILEANPAILGKNFNDARSGAKMADLAGQAAVANTQQVDYVTILMGGNDVCASSESAMTPVATFRLSPGCDERPGRLSPNAKVYVVSIPESTTCGSSCTRVPPRLVWRISAYASRSSPAERWPRKMSIAELGSAAQHRIQPAAAGGLARSPMQVRRRRGVLHAVHRSDVSTRVTSIHRPPDRPARERERAAGYGRA